MYQGYVEAIEPGSARGWVFDRRAPAERLTVELVVDGWPVASAPVDWDRPDLSVLGIGRTDCAFKLNIPSEVALDVSRLAIRVVGSREPLPMSDNVVRVDGVIEVVAQDMVSGWAWHIGHPRERLELEVRIGGRPVARGLADLFRSDLLQGNIGDGYYAYRIPLNADPAQLSPGNIQVIARKSGAILHDLRRGHGRAVMPPPPPRQSVPPRAPAAAAPQPARPVPAAAPRAAPTAAPVAAPPPRVRIEPETAPLTISREAAEALRQSMGLSGEDDSVF